MFNAVVFLWLLNYQKCPPSLSTGTAQNTPYQEVLVIGITLNTTQLILHGFELLSTCNSCRQILYTSKENANLYTFKKTTARGRGVLDRGRYPPWREYLRRAGATIHGASCGIRYWQKCMCGPYTFVSTWHHTVPHEWWLQTDINIQRRRGYDPPKPCPCGSLDGKPKRASRICLIILFSCGKFQHDSSGKRKPFILCTQIHF